MTSARPRVHLLPSPAGPGPFIAEVHVIASGKSPLGMCTGFAGVGRMGRPLCANLVWAGYVVTAGDARGELGSMGAGYGYGGAAHVTRRGGTVLITMLPGSQELHDVTLVPRSARGSASLMQWLACRAAGSAAKTMGHARLCANLAVSNATDAQLSAVEVPHISAGRPGPGLQAKKEGTLSMWVFLSARLRTWLLLAIALPLARLLVHRLAVAAERHDPSTRRAKLLRQADSAVTAVSGRSSRKARR
jgi:hypothetical protein